MLQQMLVDSTRTVALVGFGALIAQYIPTCGNARRYDMASASLLIRQEAGNRRTEGSLKVFAGEDRVVGTGRPSGGRPTLLHIRGVAAQGSFDGEYAGMDLGLAVGTLALDGKSQVRPGQSFSVLPILGVRIGNPESFLHLSFGESEIGLTPSDMLNLGLGFRLDSGRSTIRVGGGDAGFFAKGRFGLPNGAELVPVLVYGNPSSRSLGLEFDYPVWSQGRRR